MITITILSFYIPSLLKLDTICYHWSVLILLLFCCALDVNLIVIISLYRYLYLKHPRYLYLKRWDIFYL